MIRLPGRLAAAVVLMCAAFNASAQISLMPQLSQRPGGGDPRSQRADVPDSAKYEYGREVYAVKIICADCPYANAALDEKTARRYLADDELRFSLSPKEDEAVTMYLTKIFALLPY